MHPGTARGQCDRLAIGLLPAVIMVHWPHLLQRLMSSMGCFASPNARRQSKAPRKDTRAMTHPTAFIGCDVGKTHISIFDTRTNRATTLPNSPADLERWVRTLDDTCFVRLRAHRRP